MPDQTLAQRVKAKYPGQYDDLPDADLEAKIKAKYPGQYDDLPTTKAESQPAAPQASGSWLDSVADYAKGVWGQVNPIAGAQAMGQAVMHPLATAKGIGQAQGDLLTDAEKAFKSGDYAKGAARVVDWLLPVIGPQIAKAQDANTSGEWAKGAGIATGLGLQLAAPKAISQAMAPEAPMGATLAPQSDADLAKLITPQTGAKRAKFAVLAQKVAPELNARGMGAKTFDLVDQNIGQGLTDATVALKEAEAKIPATRMAPSKPFLTKLQSARDALNAGGNLPSGNEAQAAVLDRAIADVKAMGPVANFDSWRRMRQSLDSTADASGAYSRTPVDAATKLGGQAASKAAGIIRDTMPTYFPEMSAANNDYSTMITAKKVMDAAKLSQFLQATKAPAAAQGVIGQIVASVAHLGTTAGRITLLSDLVDAFSGADRTATFNTLKRIGKIAGASGADLNLLTPKEPQ